jgi:hypothetical protein
MLTFHVSMTFYITILTVDLHFMPPIVTMIINLKQDHHADRYISRNYTDPADQSGVQTQRLNIDKRFESDGELAKDSEDDKGKSELLRCAVYLESQPDDISVYHANPIIPK